MTITVATTSLSVVKFFLTKYLDSVATDESYAMHVLEGMTSYINWLPHMEKIKVDENKSVDLTFGE